MTLLVFDSENIVTCYSAKHQCVFRSFLIFPEKKSNVRGR